MLSKKKQKKQQQQQQNTNRVSDWDSAIFQLYHGAQVDFQ